MSEMSFLILESEFYKIQDELRAAQFVRVPYKENQLDMAHNTINQVQMHISRVLEMLNKIESNGVVDE